MEITVRLFAVLREHAGTSQLTLAVAEGATVGDALEALRRDAVVPAGARFVAAVQRDYVREDHVLADGDELALVPPVSGGAGPVRLVEVVEGELDVDAVRRLVADPSCGATVVFTGMTREVPSLEYEAYTEMAVEVMGRLAAEVAERHGLPAIAVAHRIGTVPLSEPSIVVAASAPHRAEAFAGARDLLDAVKATAPIFKREHPEDAEPRWVEGTLPPT